MKINQQIQNYKSIVKRGKITPDTTFEDFINKLYEEVNELSAETPLGKGFEEEIADVILTAYNLAFHYTVDIDLAIENKIKKNLKRLD